MALKFLKIEKTRNLSIIKLPCFCTHVLPRSWHKLVELLPLSPQPSRYRRHLWPVLSMSDFDNERDWPDDGKVSGYPNPYPSWHLGTARLNRSRSLRQSEVMFQAHFFYKCWGQLLSKHMLQERPPFLMRVINPSLMKGRRRPGDYAVEKPVETFRPEFHVVND